MMKISSDLIILFYELKITIFIYHSSRHFDTSDPSSMQDLHHHELKARTHGATLSFHAKLVHATFMQLLQK